MFRRAVIDNYLTHNIQTCSVFDEKENKYILFYSILFYSIIFYPKAMGRRIGAVDLDHATPIGRQKIGSVDPTTLWAGGYRCRGYYSERPERGDMRVIWYVL